MYLRRNTRILDFVGLGQNAGIMKRGILFIVATVTVMLLLSMGANQAAAQTCNNCNFCHQDMNNPHYVQPWSGCSGCHGNPPATASHTKHFGLITTFERYGDTSITKDFTTGQYYAMSCGNCHPIDPAKHRDGLVQVELYDAAAPVGSLKSLNPASAGYTPGGTVYQDTNVTGIPPINYTLGSCSSVYCHSYNVWTTPTGVPTPWTDPNPPTEPTLVTTRQYQSPTWGGSLGCTGCHANPPSSASPANEGGAGNSHEWIDASGYSNLHNYNHTYTSNLVGGYLGFDPISCKYCHYDTVRATSTWTRAGNGNAIMGNVAIYNYSKHINGTNDVVFNQVDSFPYSTSYSLSTASYDSGSKACSNVSCHSPGPNFPGQTSVKWGLPYRVGSSAECNRCHQW